MKTRITLVWFKRDLRLRDHQPLQESLKAGRPLLLFYCLEPSLMASPESDERHWRFVWQSVQDLNQQLTPYGGRVHLFHEEVIPLLTRLNEQFEIDTLFSHEETGIRITYDRDKAVKVFCREHSIQWQESRSNGVIRGLRHRLNWEAYWYSVMEAHQHQVDWERVEWAEWPFPSPTLPAFLSDPYPAFQSGGELRAHQVLQEFLQQRGRNYHRHISKPTFSRSSCSRLSAHIAWGNLSIRQIFQATRQRLGEGGWKRPLENFAMRLRWHCHFIQKFESEDRIEFENINQGYNLVKKINDPAALEAWKLGKTGYPLIDACMRCVTATGYLNFRMRAMLVSFLTHHLLQDWKPGATHLAQQFLDFEPGIHFPQFQMQAGMTGTNTIRIYNPIKQAQDHDPDGIFIRKWVPELAKLPTYAVLEPWTLTDLEQQMYEFRLGEDYPKPVVDLAISGPRARDLLWHMRQHALVQAERLRILFQHSLPNRPSER
ncbi:MAG: deoxyribodipyrimidine photo-lyase [Bacteroidota bacterium]